LGICAGIWSPIGGTPDTQLFYLPLQGAAFEAQHLGGTGSLKVDGKVASTQTLEHTLPLTKPLDTVFNIGDAAGTHLDDKDYKIPFKFTGKIHKLNIKLEPPQLSPEDIKKLKEAEVKMNANK